MKITEIAVRVPTLTIVATLLVMLWGIMYFSTMSRREDPNIEVIACWIITTFPGALPDEVEQYVTKPIEDAVAEISEVDEIYSESHYSFSQLTVMLDEDVPQDEIKQVWDNMRVKLEAIQADLPEGCSAPFLNDGVFDSASHLIAISGEHYTPRELEAFAERIKQRMGDLPSAGTVKVNGELPEQIYVEFSPERLIHYGVRMDQLAEALQTTNLMFPGGQMNLQGTTYSIDADGGFSSVEDIENLPVFATEAGQQLRLRDLAEISYGPVDPPSQIMRVNGEPAVLVSIIMKDGRNVMELGKEVEAELAVISESLPTDLNVQVVHDQPHEVGLTTNTFLNNLYQGFVLVFLVVFLFMGLRPSIPVGLAVPLSLIGSFAVFSILGTELQRIAIGGLIITLGMLVDNAIIITDMAQRHVDEGMERKQAAIKATKQLLVPVFTSTLTTIAAFGPLLLMPGMIGEFLQDIPITVSVAILISFIVAITVTPAICASLLVSTKEHKTFQPLDPLMKWLERHYPPLLTWTQRNVWITVVIIVAAFVGTMGLAKTLGVQFFPAADRDQFVINLSAPEGTSIDETSFLAASLEQVLAEQEGINSYTTSIGRSVPKFYLSVLPTADSSNTAEIMVSTESGKDTARLIPLIRAAAHSRVPGARVEVKPLELGPPVGAPVQLEIKGENIAELRRIGAEVKQILTGTDNVIDIHDSFGIERSQLKLTTDPAQLRSIGLTGGDINQVTAMLTSGYPVTQFRAPERTIPIVLRAQDEYRDESLDLNKVYIANRVHGGMVPLSSVASLESRHVIGKITRKDRTRQLKVSSFISGGRLAADVMEEIMPAISSIDLLPGYSIKDAGEGDMRSDAFGKVITAMLVALLLILIVLIAQFQSLRIALVVYLAIPLAMIGAILGLFVTGWPIGLMAMLGILSLIGIVIKNSIVLVDFIMEKLREGVPLDRAISESGQARLRPIILATATTIGGLFPLGLFGGGMWAPMAWAIIGGLLVSTVLTLIVVPLFFRMVAGKRALQLVEQYRLNNDKPTETAMTSIATETK